MISLKTLERDASVRGRERHTCHMLRILGGIYNSRKRIMMCSANIASMRPIRRSPNSQLEEVLHQALLDPKPMGDPNLLQHPISSGVRREYLDTSDSRADATSQLVNQHRR